MPKRKFLREETYKDPADELTAVAAMFRAAGCDMPEMPVEHRFKVYESADGNAQVTVSSSWRNGESIAFDQAAESKFVVDAFTALIAGLESLGFDAVVEMVVEAMRGMPYEIGSTAFIVRRVTRDLAGYLGVDVRDVPVEDIVRAASPLSGMTAEEVRQYVRSGLVGGACRVTGCGGWVSGGRCDRACVACLVHAGNHATHCLLVPTHVECEHCHISPHHPDCPNATCEACGSSPHAIGCPNAG